MFYSQILLSHYRFVMRLSPKLKRAIKKNQSSTFLRIGTDIDFFENHQPTEPPFLAWLIPLGALLLGLGSLYLFFKGSTKRSNASREIEDQILQEMNAAISHERARIKINN